MMHRWTRFASLAAVALSASACAADSTGQGALRASALAETQTEAEAEADCDCGGDQPTVDGQIAEPACDAPLPTPEVTADAIPVGDSPRLGPAGADVVVVFSADLQCGYCSRAHDTMKKLVRANAGRVAVVFKHNPLPMHEHALDAAIATEAAKRQGKFWEMVAVLFAHQDRLDRPSLSVWAAQIGLDVPTFEADLRSPELARAILADQELITSHGAHGTPTFWVSNRRLVGAHPQEAFQSLIDASLQNH